MSEMRAEEGGKSIQMLAELDGGMEITSGIDITRGIESLVLSCNACVEPVLSNRIRFSHSYSKCVAT